jgi:hypothetical protein
VPFHFLCFWDAFLLCNSHFTGVGYFRFIVFSLLSCMSLGFQFLERYGEVSMLDSSIIGINDLTLHSFGDGSLT